MNTGRNPAADFLVIPRRGPRLTLRAAGYGTIIPLWLSVEDNGVGPVIVLAAGLALLMSTLSTVNTLGGRCFPRSRLIPGLAIGGGLAGIL